MPQKIMVTHRWFLLGLPGFLIPLYYLHWFDDAVWFYEFRAMPYSELTAMGAGLFAGALAACTREKRIVSRGFLFALLSLGILIPYLKPIITPLDKSQLVEKWENGVCRQSTSSSCGAASAATIFRMFGETLSERQIAVECYTTRGGTENWYLARAFRRRGYQVQYRIESGLPDDLQLPAVAGVLLGGAGHFIPLLEEQGDRIVVGDPLVGRELIPKAEISERYSFTGFFMEIGGKL